MSVDHAVMGSAKNIYAGFLDGGWTDMGVERSLGRIGPRCQWRFNLGSVAIDRKDTLLRSGR
jgi:mannose-1-phosphate guanylyltransferase